MNKLKRMIEHLQSYDGAPVRVMEVCGTHTATAAKAGLRSLLPSNIRLISGPGCPVCLAASAYIDRLCELAAGGCIIASFGDLLRVQGKSGSLLDMKARGARVEMVYSPLDALKLARVHPESTVVMAAVGFETTAPAYALALETAMAEDLSNFKLLTALKRLIPAMEALCPDESVDAFITPGHVAAVIGSDVFIPLAQRFHKPMVVAGFDAEDMLAAICLLLSKLGTGYTANLYGEVVRPQGNAKALALLDKYFEPGEAYWRGLSVIPDSGFYLKKEYAAFDAGSYGLLDSVADSGGCRCGEVLTGKIDPAECPLFGGVCTPANAFGPCMVSAEGACGIRYAGEGWE
jgi:hydrogenase expression/formation protein HypD